MAELLGRECAVKLSTNTVLSCNEWSLNLEIATIPATDFGDTWEEFLVGLRGASGQFVGRFDPSDTNGHVALQTEALSGTSGVSLRLYINGSNYYSGTALITSFAPKADVGGAVTVTYGYRFTGTVSYT